MSEKYSYRLSDFLTTSQHRGFNMQTWQIQEAKSHFSAVVDCAISQGAQLVTRRGNNVAVIMSVKDYEQLSGEKGNLMDVLMNAPKGETLSIERSNEVIRDILL
jgi:prevent-host-death family protein